MSILTLFVVIPVLMLLGLWLAKNDKQVRGVMVVGASCLLLLAIYLTITFVQMRNAGNTDAMLFTYSVPWFAPLHIDYSVGVDGISVVMLLLSAVIVFTGTFRFMAP
jgi:NADH-quinone oxidoreductase subunit M